MAENDISYDRSQCDSEKITINLGYVDLGHIDLMVQDGFYSNRTDFIRTAIVTNSNAMPRSSNNQPPERSGSWSAEL